jgi:membrane-associated phospholipid phosphatase
MNAPDHHARFSFGRLAALVGVGAGAIALAHLADRAVFLGVHAPGVAVEDWGRGLRIAGYVPTWLVVAAAMALIDGRRRVFDAPLRDRWSRGATMALAPIVAGLLAEACKLLVRRERPSMPDGAYVFRSFGESPWSTGGLGMPSSHTAVAFGAAAILCRLHPAAWPVWIAVAIGCGATRVASRAHFLSDVVGGAMVGVAGAAIVWRLHVRGGSRGGGT